MVRESVRLTKYFLRKWYYLDSNISELNEAEVTNVKVLYGALKNLTPDERKFLADKYRVSIKPHRTDKDLAEEYGMDLASYVYKRVKIEEKLSPFIKQSKDKYKKHSIPKLDDRIQKRLDKQKEEFMAMIEKEAKERHRALLQSINNESKEGEHGRI